MSGFLNTLVGEIRSGDLLALIEELEQVCPVVSQDFLKTPFIAFLTQCVYPGGLGKRAPLSTVSAAWAPLLESRVGKLPEGDLRELCAELAKLRGVALEFFQGGKVCALLNKTLPKHPVPTKPPAKQSRWDAVIRQRRANR
jgi:hypothetical protein